MIRYSGIFLSLLMLSGCATEALKKTNKLKLLLLRVTKQ